MVARSEVIGTGSWEINRKSPHPSTPVTFKQALDSWLAPEWKAAINTHLATHNDPQTWTDIFPQAARGKQIIDCKWVFAYKIDADGYLSNCKARLVARGDQYDDPDAETYAATLTLRSFRIYLALVRAKHMISTQHDVHRIEVRNHWACPPQPIRCRQMATPAM